MKNFKQLKQAVLKNKQKIKVRNITQRIFGKLHANFGFTYFD